MDSFSITLVLFLINCFIASSFKVGVVTKNTQRFGARALLDRIGRGKKICNSKAFSNPRNFKEGCTITKYKATPWEWLENDFITGSKKTLDISDNDLQLKTLSRVAAPSVLLSIFGAIAYKPLSLYIANTLIQNDPSVLDVISQDTSQYIQNILTTSGLMFSILVGYTYYFMYQQQESIYCALFSEVGEAKSLLEQIALLCAGRSMYYPTLECFQQYLKNDLKKSSILSYPANFLVVRDGDDSKNQAGTKEDPLEAIMYMTSVGTPSVVYETVKSLRMARAHRLGALQRKLPEFHIMLLRTLALVVLVTFPVCGAGSQIIGGEGILNVQSIYFGILIFGIACVLNVVTELWESAGGAYNIDCTLSVMVKGLEQELIERLSEKY